MITFVNVFTVNPGQQDVAFEHIQQLYTEVVKVQTGFMDATLLKSDDGTTITAIAHWDTPDTLLQALWAIPRFQDLYNQDLKTAIAKVTPHIYSTSTAV